MDQPLYLPTVRRRYRNSGGPEAWGTPMPLLHASITELPEKELVAHVFSDPHYRRTLLNVKGIGSQGTRVLQQIELRHFRPDVVGEVDLLVIPEDRPELSTAIQVKRLKAVVSTDDQGHDDIKVGHARRYSELMAKGCEQASKTKAVGFAQVYLWVFVVIDTRARNNGWYTYDGPDSELHSRVDQAVSSATPRPPIGMMTFEWVQPMDRPPFELCTHGGHLVRLAEATTQPAELTAWLAQLPG